MNYTDDMNQVATYWAPLSGDGLGGIGFAAPILVSCRWENRAVLYKSRDGKDVVSRAVVYPDQPLLDRGWLALDDRTATADPKSVTGAQEIQQVGASPSLDDDVVLNKAWL